MVVQVNKYSAIELQLLSLDSVTKALQNDLDMDQLNSSDLPKILQSISVATGCDYIYFFSEIRKATLQNKWVIATHFLESKYCNSDNPLPELE